MCISDKGLVPTTNSKQNKLAYNSCKTIQLKKKKKVKDFQRTSQKASQKTGEGNGTPLQYSCQENPMDRGAWWAAVHGVTKSRTRLRDLTVTFHFHVLEKEMATHSSVLA